MSFLDFTDADLIALTRQRRAERAAAVAAARPTTARFSILDQLAKPPDPSAPPFDPTEPPPPERFRPAGWEPMKPERWCEPMTPVVRSHGARRRGRAWRLAQWELGVRWCCYCAVRMTLGRGYSHSATLEHREPITLGGAEDDQSNWAVSCARCNHAKGALTEAEFLAIRGGEAFPVPWS